MQRRGWGGVLKEVVYRKAAVRLNVHSPMARKALMYDIKFYEYLASQTRVEYVRFHNRIISSSYAELIYKVWDIAQWSRRFQTAREHAPTLLEKPIGVLATHGTDLS